MERYITLGADENGEVYGLKLGKVVKQIYPDNESEEQGRIILEVANA